jgi:hypothetical protein
MDSLIGLPDTQCGDMMTKLSEMPSDHASPEGREYFEDVVQKLIQFAICNVRDRCGSRGGVGTDVIARRLIQLLHVDRSSGLYQVIVECAAADGT